VVASIVAIEVLFFKGVIFDAAKLIGDAQDARLNNFILEHWFSVFKFQESPADLPIFYPLSDTLGYSDMLFGFSIPYSLLRLCSIDMFTANKIVLIAIHALGSVGMFLLLRRKFNLSIAAALIGTLIFSYSSAYHVRTGHTQLFFFSVLPILLHLVINFFQDFHGSETVRLRRGLVIIVLFGLILNTSFYVGFFVMLASSIYLAQYLIRGRSRIRNMIQFVWSFITTRWLEVVIYGVALLLVLTPFFLVYYPITQTFGHRAWTDLSLPNWYSLFNSSPQNRLWGGMLQTMNLINGGWEFSVGFGLLTGVALTTSIIHFNRKVPHATDFPLSKIYSGFSIVVVVILAIIIRVDGFSLWWFIFKYFPTATGIRAVARMEFFATLFAAVLIAAFVDYYYRRLISSQGKVALFVVLFLLLGLDNSLKPSTYSAWTRSSMEDYLSHVSQPPADARVYYLIDSNLPEGSDKLQLDAWMIGLKYGLKTFNGYSGWRPPHWELGNIAEDRYWESIRNWMTLNKVDSVYSYDHQQDLWVKRTLQNLVDHPDTNIDIQSLFQGSDTRK
jgi:hypothetical protein